MKKQRSKEEIENSEEDKDESDLEEEIEDSSLENIEIRDDISDTEFIEFLNPSENTAPSLQQVEIATELRATDLEQGVSNAGSLETNKKEEDPFKYKVGSDLNEEPKYISSGNEIERINLPSNVDMMTLGKEESLLPKPIGFSASPTTKIGESDEMYKFINPEKSDTNKLGKGNIFEKKDVKYTPSEEY